MKFHEQPITKVHIEPTSRCNARCPQCLRTMGASLETLPELQEYDADSEKFEEILRQDFFEHVTMFHVNGNLGDIVMHPDPYAFVNSMRSVTPNAWIKINTNGGGLKKEFWEWFGKMPNTEVEFGIDGLSDTHHLYRRNTRWDKVIENAQTYINAGGTATWSMLIFKHNEHQVQECKNLADSMNFFRFEAKPSVRWHKKDLVVVDKHYKESYRISPSSSVTERTFHLESDNSTPSKFIEYLNRGEDKTFKSKRHLSCIICKAKSDRSIYISADLKMWPCCWVKNSVDQKKWYGHSCSFTDHFYEDLGYDENFNRLDLHDIENILETGLLDDISSSWQGDAFQECIRTCGTDNQIDYRVEKTKIWDKK